MPWSSLARSPPIFGLGRLPFSNLSTLSKLLLFLACFIATFHHYSLLDNLTMKGTRWMLDAFLASTPALAAMSFVNPPPESSIQSDFGLNNVYTEYTLVPITWEGTEDGISADVTLYQINTTLTDAGTDTAEAACMWRPSHDQVQVVRIYHAHKADSRSQSGTWSISPVRLPLPTNFHTQGHYEADHDL